MQPGTMMSMVPTSVDIAGTSANIVTPAIIEKNMIDNPASTFEDFKCVIDFPTNA